LIPNFLETKCTKGTLQCDYSNPDHPKPRICDFLNFYFFNLETETCEKKSVQGCEIPSYDIEKIPCFKCEPGLMLDKELMICKSIPQSQLIPNCSYYSFEGTSCVECNSGYWMFGGGCKQIKGEVIPSCVSYLSEDLCQQCDSGYFLENNQCLQFNTLEGCAFHTNRVCTSCQDGYIFDSSLNFFSLQDNKISDDIYQFTNKKAFWSQENNLSTSCTIGKIKNCVKYDTISKCKECKENYLLTEDFQCEHSPESPILNCKEYLNATFCLKCNNGFYLTNSTTCQEATPIEYCKETAVDEDKCSECEKAYTLNEEGTLCTERINFPITNCMSFNIFQDKCDSCDGNYSLTDDSLWCYSNIKNCKDQVNAPNKESQNHICQTCEEFFYLENPVKCSPVTVDKCKRYIENTNQCVECEEMYFVIGNYRDKCQLRSVDRCDKYISNTNQCESCLEGYYLENSMTCTRQRIDNCVEFQSNLNSCSKCIDGFYPSVNGDLCLTKSISNCEEYNIDGTNTCTRCSSLTYPLNNGTQCDDISHPEKCISSDGLTNSCTECYPQFFKENGLCTGILDSSLVDPFCYSNNNTSNTLTCSTCKPFFARMKSTKLAVDFDFFETQKCAKIDSSTGACIQCSNFHEFQNNICVSVNDPSSVKCKRLLPNQTNSLASNQFCEECSNDSLYYLSSNSCQDRQNSTISPECAKTDLSSDSDCIACSENTLALIPLHSISFTVPTCVNSSNLPNTFSSIENCVAYKADYTCRICDISYIVSADGLSCVDKNFTVDLSVTKYFDKHLNPSGVFSGTISNIDNCEIYDQISPSEYGCSSCSFESIKSVPQPLSSNIQPYKFGSAGNFSGFLIDYYNAFTCVSNSIPFLLENDQPHVKTENCNISYQIPNSTGYACLSCIYPYRGEIVTIHKDANGSSFTTPFRSIGNCTDENYDLDSIYRLQNYEIRESPHRLLWSNYMQFDSCVDDTMILVYMYITSIKEPFINFVSASEIYDEPLKQAYCLDSSQIPSLIQNCAIYVLSEDLSSTFDPDFDSLSNAKCIACFPGYQSTLNLEGTYIDSCSQISECNMDNPVWLGACSDPENLSWELERKVILGKEIELTAYHKPVKFNERINNCLIIDRNATDIICRLCTTSYTVQNGACVEISSLDSNCETTSLGLTAIEIKSHLSNFQFSYMMYLRLNENNFSDDEYSQGFCGACLQDHIPVFSNQIDLDGWLGLSHEKICTTPVPGQIIPSFDSNCSHIDFNSPSLCHKCKADLILDETLNQCHPSSSHLNCVALETVDNLLRCKQCKSEYLLNSVHQCALHNCKEWDFTLPHECAVCLPGFQPAPNSKSFCIPETTPSDFCELFSPSLGHCIKCKQSNHIPYIFQRVALPPENLKIECVLFPFDSHFLSMYRLQYPFVLIHVMLDNSIDTVSLETVNTQDQQKRTLTNLPSDFPEFHCGPTIPVSQCDPNHFSNYLICQQCTSGYLLSEFNTCQLGLISSCNKYSPNNSQCDECEFSHYLSQDGSECINRKHSITCINRSLTSDECLSCDSDEFWLHPTFKECRPNTSENCLIYESTSDKCNTCLDNFWKNVDTENDTVTCESYTAENCETFNSSKNECLTCQEGYLKHMSSGSLLCSSYTAQNCSYLKANTDECLSCIPEHFLKFMDNKFECVPCDIDNCLSHVENKNECQLCNPSFYLKDSQCFPLTKVSSCIAYNSKEDRCSQCENGYYLKIEINECLPFPNGIPNCIKYSSPSTCSQCSDQYFLENNICQQVTSIINYCSVYDSPITCSKCVSGFILDPQANSCNSFSIENCIIPSTSTSCSVCEDAFFPNDAGECERSPIQNCLKPNLSDTSLCLECSPNYVLSEDSSSCIRVTQLISNCASYHLDQTCKQCDSGHILSIDKLSCQNLSNQAGSFCSNAMIIEDTKCDVCQLGYTKNSEGHCRFSKVSKCWITDSSGSVCLLCESGTYMDSTGKCIFDHISFALKYREFVVVSFLVFLFF
jgi:hypothetical protein